MLSWTGSRWYFLLKVSYASLRLQMIFYKNIVIGYIFITVAYVFSLSPHLLSIIVLYDRDRLQQVRACADTRWALYCRWVAILPTHLRVTEVTERTRWRRHGHLISHLTLLKTYKIPIHIIYKSMTVMNGKRQRNTMLTYYSHQTPYNNNNNNNNHHIYIAPLRGGFRGAELSPHLDEVTISRMLWWIYVTVRRSYC